MDVAPIFGTKMSTNLWNENEDRKNKKKRKELLSVTGDTRDPMKIILKMLCFLAVLVMEGHLLTVLLYKFRPTSLLNTIYVL
ncbi:hypothetical protein E2C01_039734 [Portunus trituberculatus]|uniref:Uncharacterized protein n=1 Tax=Portunus trituberculatus TaxID=210409 RepID=A0A5B7FKK5_PORTR|nr:hypothetical protein [Portunus trituberculatus]